MYDGVMGCIAAEATGLGFVLFCCFQPLYVASQLSFGFCFVSVYFPISPEIIH